MPAPPADVRYVPVARARALWPAAVTLAAGAVLAVLFLRVLGPRGVGAALVFVVFALIFLASRTKGGMQRPPLGVSPTGLVVDLPSGGRRVVPWEAVRDGWIAARGRPRAEHVCFAVDGLPDVAPGRSPLVVVSDADRRHVAILAQFLAADVTAIDALVREASGGRVRLLTTLPPGLPAVLRTDTGDVTVLRAGRSWATFLSFCLAAVCGAILLAQVLGLIVVIAFDVAAPAWATSAMAVLWFIALAGFIVAAGATVAFSLLTGPGRPVTPARLTADGIDLVVASRTYSLHVPWERVQMLDVAQAPAGLLRRGRVRAVRVVVGIGAGELARLPLDQRPWLTRVRNELGCDVAFAVRRDEDLAAAGEAARRFTNGRLRLGDAHAGH
ncbi:MAG: hypothetical protein GEV10_08170 [Streptosporangiales bacterium]|nr:hypothetical protein [Streptosporangiales bacterium]